MEVGVQISLSESHSSPAIFSPRREMVVPLGKAQGWALPLPHWRKNLANHGSQQPWAWPKRHAVSQKYKNSSPCLSPGKEGSCRGSLQSPAISLGWQEKFPDPWPEGALLQQTQPLPSCTSACLAQPPWPAEKWMAL